MKCSISISIVVYRGFDDALAAIESIERHTNPLLLKKIYIIDNSAYENTNEKQSAFVASLSKFQDVIYVNTQENMGFGKGHNYVLDKIDSQYHAIVNPDIILYEDTLSKIVDYMNHNRSVGMCIPRIVTLDGSIQPAYRRELTIFDMFIRMFCKKGFKKRKFYHTMQDMDYSKEFSVPFGQGSFLVIKSELFKGLRGFDDRYFMYLEDADLCKRVNQVSSLMYYPYATAVHKWEKESHRNIRLFKIHLKSMVSYFLKWGIKWK
ncbi:MAG: glycosyltransferase [Clostridium baratii]